MWRQGPYYKCTKYVSGEADVARIKELKICARCLGNDHFGSNCVVKL